MNEMYFCPFSAPTISHCPSNWTFLVQIVFLCYLGLFWICTKEGKHFQVHFSCFRYKYFTPQPFIWGVAHFLLFLGDWAIGLWHCQADIYSVYEHWQHRFSKYFFWKSSFEWSTKSWWLQIYSSRQNITFYKLLRTL